MHLVTITLNMKSRVIEIKSYQFKNILIRLPYSGNMINHLKTKSKWKIQLSVAIDFMPSKDTNETRAMYSKSDNKEIMICNGTDQII